MLSAVRSSLSAARSPLWPTLSAAPRAFHGLSATLPGLSATLPGLSGPSEPEQWCLSRGSGLGSGLGGRQGRRGLRKDGQHVKPEGGRKWMVRVLERSKQAVCAASLGQMARRLQYLEDAGCKAYQLMEYPQALALSEEELVDAVSQLRQHGPGLISIPLVRIARGVPRRLPQRLNTFLTRRHGYPSMADFLKAKLDCSEEELMDLLDRNPRLLQASDLSALEAKLELLLSYGASTKDIRRHSHVLKNRHYDVIARRAAQLSDLGCNNPLPIKWLTAGDQVFDKVVANYKASLKDNQERNEFFHKVLHCSEEDLPPNLPVLKQRFKTLKPKIDFLTSKGFRVEEMLSERVLILSLKTLRDTYTLLEDHGIDDISLPILYHFVVHRRIRSKPHARTKLSSVVDIKESGLVVPPELMRLLFMQKRAVLIENYRFLLDAGFSKESLQRLIIVIGHDPRVLRHHWALLPERPELFPFESWKQDEWKLLNLLQYYIEKEVCFKQPVVLDADSVI